MKLTLRGLQRLAIVVLALTGLLQAMTGGIFWAGFDALFIAIIYWMMEPWHVELVLLELRILPGSGDA